MFGQKPFRLHRPNAAGTRSGILDSAAAFTLAEVCVAVAVASFFGAAAFVTNSQLLVGLRTQKESTAATMVLQQRIESMRASSYSDVANKDYLLTNIFSIPTGSEAPLGNLKEQVSVGVYGDTTTAPIVLLRDPAHPTPQVLSTNSNLAGAAANPNGLLQADILLQWTSANGRVRTRTLSALFGKGNLGP